MFILILILISIPYIYMDKKQNKKTKHRDHPYKIYYDPINKRFYFLVNGKKQYVNNPFNVPKKRLHFTQK